MRWKFPPFCSAANLIPKLKQESRDYVVTSRYQGALNLPLHKAMFA